MLSSLWGGEEEEEGGAGLEDIFSATYGGLMKRALQEGVEAFSDSPTNPDAWLASVTNPTGEISAPQLHDDPSLPRNVYNVSATGFTTVRLSGISLPSDQSAYAYLFKSLVATFQLASQITDIEVGDLSAEVAWALDPLTGINLSTPILNAPVTITKKGVYMGYALNTSSGKPTADDLSLRADAERLLFNTVNQALTNLQSFAVDTRQNRTFTIRCPAIWPQPLLKYYTAICTPGEAPLSDPNIQDLGKLNNFTDILSPSLLNLSGDIFRSRELQGSTYFYVQTDGVPDLPTPPYSGMSVSSEASVKISSPESIVESLRISADNVTAIVDNPVVFVNSSIAAVYTPPNNATNFTALFANGTTLVNLGISFVGFPNSVVTFGVLESTTVTSINSALVSATAFTCGPTALVTINSIADGSSGALLYEGQGVQRLRRQLTALPFDTLSLFVASTVKAPALLSRALLLENLQSKSFAATISSILNSMGFQNISVTAVVTTEQVQSYSGTSTSSSTPSALALGLGLGFGLGIGVVGLLYYLHYRKSRGESALPLKSTPPLKLAQSFSGTGSPSQPSQSSPVRAKDVKFSIREPSKDLLSSVYSEL